METQKLTIWTIYYSPSDFPGEWVARMFELDQPTKSILRASGLDDLRELIQKNSAHVRDKIPRFDNDDPYIIESWI